MALEHISALIRRIEASLERQRRAVMESEAQLAAAKALQDAGEKAKK